jgi:ketosteroid isomerase-like protein
MNGTLLMSLKHISPIILLFFLSLLTQKDLFAQQNNTPSSVIESFFDGMRASDGETLQTLITEDATLHTITQREGETVKAATDMNRFLDSVSNAPTGLLNEQLTSLEVHIDGDLATAWMEYNFFRGDEFSHCGVNSMNLIRTSDGWKIFSVVDTRRTDDCDLKEK